MISKRLELIGSGFAHQRTAFLASAALSRLEQDLTIKDQMVVLTRDNEGVVKIREPKVIDHGAIRQTTFWERLITLIFETSDSATAVSATEELARIGVDEVFSKNFLTSFPAGTSAILVVANQSAKDRVLGVLHGLRGKISRTRICGDKRGAWREILLNSLGDMENDKVNNRELKEAD